MEEVEGAITFSGSDWSNINIQCYEKADSILEAV